jgi:two-component system response regulator RegX3
MAERILVVEDEEAYRETLRFLLEKDGFEVITASSGPEGVEKFARHAPQLVLLDLMLPRMSGIEVFNRIRKLADTPVIMVTAKGDEEHRVAGLELGADDYISKPFSARELVARVHAVLRRTSPWTFDEPEPAIESARGITLNPERLTMERGGVTEPMPPKEFALLLTLMQSKGRVLTRDTLIARVWGEDYVGDTKTLDVHIKRLRGKVEENPSNPVIIGTVRGLGYVFEVE